MQPITKRSLGVIILSSTLLFNGASQAGEAKIDTLKNPLTVTKSVQLVSEFKVIKIPTIEINPPVIEPLQAETKDEIDEYQIFEITAFTSGYESTQKKRGEKGYGITASGKRVKENHTIACPKSIEFETEIYIKELNRTYVCEDRGNRITEEHIDIYMDDVNRAKTFGRKKMSVKIIEGSDKS